MPELIVKNSCMVVEDYNLGDCPELEKIFRIYNPITHRYDILGMYYSVKERKLYIPRGLDIWRVKKQLGIKDHKNISPNPYLELNINLETTSKKRL